MTPGSAHLRALVFALLLVLASGCGTAKIYLKGQRSPVVGDIITSSADSLTIKTGGRYVVIPARQIKDIDHPGNAMMGIAGGFSLAIISSPVFLAPAIVFLAIGGGDYATSRSKASRFHAERLRATIASEEAEGAARTPDRARAPPKKDPAKVKEPARPSRSKPEEPPPQKDTRAVLPCEIRRPLYLISSEILIRQAKLLGWRVSDEDLVVENYRGKLLLLRRGTLDVVVLQLSYNSSKLASEANHPISYRDGPLVLAVEYADDEALAHDLLNALAFCR